MAVETHQPIRMCILILLKPVVRQRGASAAATSSKREDLPELVDHLIDHHEALFEVMYPSAIIRQHKDWQQRSTGNLGC